MNWSTFFAKLSGLILIGMTQYEFIQLLSFQTMIPVLDNICLCFKVLFTKK